MNWQSYDQIDRKRQAIQWNEEQRKAFQDLKEMLSQATILVHPKSQGDFVLDTDASNEGIGAVLSQMQDGQERVEAYGSKMLMKTEHNYCITRRELLAVIHFVTQFKHFPLGQKFLFRTDNSSVRYWMRIYSDSYDPQGQIARWLVKLAVFDFEIKHRMGKQHSNADGMLRCPLLRCAQCEIIETYETKKGKKMDVVTMESSTQTDILWRKSRNRGTDKIRSLLPAQREREGKEKNKPAQNSPVEPKRDLECQTSKVSKRGTPPSWMETGVCLDKVILREEQLKDPACVDALCWIRQGSRPG